MNILFEILIGLAAGVLMFLAAFAFILAWVIQGSPDVNGDPERDAGYTDQEIAAMPQARRREARREQWERESRLLLAASRQVSAGGFFGACAKARRFLTLRKQKAHYD